jgi:hypothetical protein
MMTTYMHMLQMLLFTAVMLLFSCLCSYAHALHKRIRDKQIVVVTLMQCELNTYTPWQSSKYTMKPIQNKNMYISSALWLCMYSGDISSYITHTTALYYWLLDLVAVLLLLCLHVLLLL